MRAALTSYAHAVRDRLDLDESPILSATGLWLLLAAVADDIETPAERTELEHALGMTLPEARAAVETLLAAPHPAVGTALGAWLRNDLRLTTELRGPVPLAPMPTQPELDAWASERTRGLVPRFPVEVDAITLLLLASALVTEPRWQLGYGPGGRLRLVDDLQAVVRTRAAGLVAVACPRTDDGVDVLSVIAAPDIPARDVWRAVDEIVDARLAGTLTHATMPSDAPERGHAWRIFEDTGMFLEHQAPAEGTLLWSTLLPVWKTAAEHDLLEAPGVRAAADGLVALLPPQELRDGVDVECVQAATAEYDKDGFRAAAVTAMSLTPRGLPPQRVARRIRRVEVNFDRPHALVAVARGGVWEGVPLFSAWVSA